jgi:hypothetical protein
MSAFSSEMSFSEQVKEINHGGSDKGAQIVQNGVTFFHDCGNRFWILCTRRVTDPHAAKDTHRRQKQLEQPSVKIRNRADSDL